MVVRNLLDNGGQAGSEGATGHHATICLGQEQHVVDDARQAMEFFQVRGQDLRQIETRRAAQCQFVAGKQCRQRSAKLVGNIRVEPFQLGVGLVQPAQQPVELLHQGRQLSGLP